MLRIVRNGGSVRLLTDAALVRGETVARFRGDPAPAGRSLATLPGVVASMRHSCDPNSVVDLEGVRLVALRDIEPGEELRCFYPATEWDVAPPIHCDCGSPRCLREIAGARALEPAVLTRYYLSRHIRRAAGLKTGPLEIPLRETPLSRRT